MSASGSWRIGEVLNLYARIALLRRGPEDLPVSQSLLLGTIVAYVLASLAASGLLPPQPGESPAQPGEPWVAVAIDVGLMLTWLVLVLWLAKHPERFLQTASAVFGFQLVLAPAFLAGMWAWINFREDATWQLPVSLVVVALGLWALVISARILRSATGWPMFACVALVLAQALLARGALLLVFPDAAGNAAAAIG